MVGLGVVITITTAIPFAVITAIIAAFAAIIITARAAATGDLVIILIINLFSLQLRSFLAQLNAVQSGFLNSILGLTNCSVPPLHPDLPDPYYSTPRM